MLHRGGNAGLKHPLATQTLTDFSAGTPTALDHMGPALNREFDVALQSGEDRLPEPPVKVGRLMETTVVEQPNEFICDTVRDHFKRLIRYDPYASKLEEGRVHFRIPPFNNYVTNPSSWTFSMKLNIRLWFQRPDEGITDSIARLLQDPEEAAKVQQMVSTKKYGHLTGSFKLLGEHLLIDHIKVVANDDKDLNAGLGKDLDDFVDWVDYMFKFTQMEKENDAVAYKTLRRMGLLSGEGRLVLPCQTAA